MRFVKKIQHIGIPTQDMEATIKWYQEIGAELIYETVLSGNVRVAFVEVCGTLLEFYEEKVEHAKVAVIHSLVFISTMMEDVLTGPNGEMLIFHKGDANKLTISIS